ncbi:MAG: polyprenyl diphosphate synthase, partial [Flavobacteriales bacterium]
MDLLPKIDKHNIPKHVAIIMDGNGRWAKEQGKDRIFGHFNGVESVRATLKAATRCGVQHLTLYAFSTENWNRPQDEVNALMDLLVQTILNEIDELHSNEVRLHAIGDISNLPTQCISALKEGMERTSNNSKINLHLALSYSSRWEIIEAVRQIIREGRAPDEVNAE